MFDDDKDGASNHQQQHLKNTEDMAPYALWRCCEYVLDQSTASTSMGQCSKKWPGRTQAYEYTRQFDQRCFMHLGFLKCLGFWFALFGCKKGERLTHMFSSWVSADGNSSLWIVDSMESYWAYLAFYLNFG